VAKRLQVVECGTKLVHRQHGALILPMIGRGMRSSDDWCVCVVLDKQFRRLLGRHRNACPAYVSETLQFGDPVPVLRLLESPLTGPGHAPVSLVSLPSVSSSRTSHQSGAASMSAGHASCFHQCGGWNYKACSLLKIVARTKVSHRT
jgi:hypothetical protein